MKDLSFRYKSDRRGSNPRSRPWQGRALPTTPLSHKRVMGIEPTYPAWKAGVLPLNYTRIFNCSQVGVTGFEPATSWSQTRRSSQAEPHPEGFVCVLSVTQELVYSKGKNMSTTFFIFFIFFLKWLPDSLKELPGRHFIRIRCN